MAELILAPNPIPVGGTLTITVRRKARGEYNFELTLKEGMAQPDWVRDGDWRVATVKIEGMEPGSHEVIVTIRRANVDKDKVIEEVKDTLKVRPERIKQLEGDQGDGEDP